MAHNRPVPILCADGVFKATFKSGLMHQVERLGTGTSAEKMQEQK